jgi:hypothetical protein
VELPRCSSFGAEIRATLLCGSSGLSLHSIKCGLYRLSGFARHPLVGSLSQCNLSANLRDRQIYSPGSAVSEGGAKQQCSAVGLVVLRKIEDSQKKLARTRGPPILPLKHAFATSQKSRGERQSSLSNFTAAQQTNNDASLSCFCGTPSHVQPC